MDRVQSLLDAHEVSRLLGLKISTIYKLSMARRIPTVKIGGALRFRPDAIQSYIDQCSRKAVVEQ